MTPYDSLNLYQNFGRALSSPALVPVLATSMRRHFPATATYFVFWTVHFQ